MQTFLVLQKENTRSIPEEFQIDDNRFPEILVEYFLNKYTDKGDKVIDIFAGLGTTLFVAEQMERVVYGIEYDTRRFEYIQSQLAQKDKLIHGDALRLEDYELPQFDFCITSPPYMSKDEKLNPFTGSTTAGRYGDYLNDLRTIFTKVKGILKAKSFLVIEVSNLKGVEVTTLAWDIAQEISNIFQFEGEIVIGWEADSFSVDEGTYGYGYDHSYCLVFRNAK
ncbi:MAG: DNA methyltransferase [Candidatus Hodarchaeales archaeon]|jgi:DNA modification methylase